MSLRKSNTSRFGFRTLLLCFCIIVGWAAQAQHPDFTPYEKYAFQSGEQTLPYRLLRPVNTDTSKRFPLVIFLHGAFEKGTDNEAQLGIGGRFFLRDSVRNRYPTFVLFPQCPETDSWAYFDNTMNLTTGQAENWKFPFRKQPTGIAGALKNLIDSLVQQDKVDTKRIYIAGLSQGGMGVLDMIARYPDTFAAGISICGAGNVTTVKQFNDKVALWLFHGEKDDVVPASFSRSYYKKLQKQNGDVRYTEYPQTGHNSWVKAFAEPDFLMWLFSKQKK